MKFTLSWLKQFLETNASLEEISHTLTMIGLEVEEIYDNSKTLQDFEVAKIIDTKSHPGANKLQICAVKTASNTLQIICGASNAKTGIKVVLAKVGVIIPNGNFKIRKSSIRGIESCGMLCSADEIGITGGDSSGILELDNKAIIGDKICKYLGEDDPVLHVNITPNRADALGVYGIARDLAAADIGKLITLNIPKIRGDFTSNIKLQNKNKKACKFFAIREIKNIENKESPKWLVNYLKNIGVGSVSPIVDITNYISYTFGQPMHAYDADKISDELVVDTLKEKTRFEALNHKSYELAPNDIIIRDNNELHSLAGVIGGINSLCTKNTTRIILEAAVFNPSYIAKTAKNLQINTDAKYRFERHVDSNFTLNALNIATELILSICGGDASNITTTGNDKFSGKVIDFPIDYLKSRTNIDLNLKEVQGILIKLGFMCSTENNVINITVPSWRYDVTMKDDIVEEIVRIYGYDKLPETPLPIINNVNIIPKEQTRISDIKRLIANSGYTELVTWSFMDNKKAKLFSKIKDELKLQNPISSDLDYMRPSILPNLLTALHNNINRSFYNLSLFEVGPIFEHTGIEIINHACGVRIGSIAKKNCHEETRKFDIFDIKADLAYILESVNLDIDKCQIKNDAPEYYHPTRSASLSLGKNVIGYFGQVHPSILKEFSINIDVMAFELNITNLPYSKNKFGKRTKYITSDYQKITRDYAFIIDDSQPIGDVLNLIKNIDRKLIKNVDIFDIYSGTNIEQGKKSVALSITIQDNNKTLEESDINKLNNLIIDNMIKKFNAILRDS